jgi:glycosyltransferase involved in cell wall biosynthesis
MDVSVVIPVFNPGTFIERCIRGLLAQTLGPERCEFVFVDDGSTDQTPRRLDELAAAHPNVIVRHEPNSGWPGRPRNIGIDVSSGDFVFFCDHDDWLEPDALETLLATARRTGADIVVGKMVGHRRAVPIELFRASRDRATVFDSGLMWALTPHKLFRRDLLNRHGLRFPEGKRRLEDHTFVTGAYFAADVISVVADRPIYHHIRRADAGNAAFTSSEPVSFYGYAREGMDIVAQHTVPGPQRDRAMWRFMRSYVLDRLSEPTILRASDAKLAATFREIRTLLLERYPQPALDRPWPLHRARAAAIRNDRLDLVVDIARRAATVAAAGTVIAAAGDGTTWRLTVDATLRDTTGLAVAVVDDTDGWRVPSLIPIDAEDRPSSSEEILTSLRGRLTLRERTSFEEWIVPGSVTTSLPPSPAAGSPAHPARAHAAHVHTAHVHTMAVQLEAELDPRTIAGGRPLQPGRWDVRLGITGLGLNRRAGLQIPADVIATLPPTTVYGTPAVFVQPIRQRDGTLRVDIMRSARRLAAVLARDPQSFGQSSGRRLRLTLPLLAAPDFERLLCWVELRAATGRTGRTGLHRGALRPSDSGGMQVDVRFAPDRHPAPGDYEIWLTFRRADRRNLIGRITIEPESRPMATRIIARVRRHRRR